ncbi:polysaccharide deacetylase family protein [Bacteroides sp. HPS0048]|uniref:polysaccharide deacetylase family protein n=1 Tax=Bacteroides sp. HPS0048 TaxID=1078089 RepID=UPI003561B746
MKDAIRTILFFIGYLFYRNRDSKIIYYHDISSDTFYTDMSTDLNIFRNHIKIIRKCGFEIVQQITAKKNQIAIMFDDGFRGIWDNRDYFVDNKIYPTVFIAKSLIGKEGYLNEDEIRELFKLGFDFQSHTVSHVKLTDCVSSEQLNSELLESKLYIDELLQQHTTAICAPNGYYSNIVCEDAYRVGYDKFYSSIPGSYYERITDFSFVVTRNLVQSLSLLQFRLVILGGYKPFQKTYLKRRYKLL